MSDEACVSSFRGLLGAVSVPAWESGVNEHLTSVVHELHTAAAKAFPLEKRRPRACYLSASTLALIATRRAIQKAL
eukprot:6692206-Pyramimonas_sp.AAC.1